MQGEGQRAPDQPLAERARLYQCLGAGFVLLAPATAPALDEVVARYSAIVSRKAHLETDGLCLVRPDGYVAFESASASARDARQLEQLLRKQVRLPNAPPLA